MQKILNELRQLKNNYNLIKSKIYKLKTKRAIENNREKLVPIRRKFRELEARIDFTCFDIRQLNLMAPHSGPWCLVDAHSFKLEASFYFSFEFKGNATRYVGEFSLLENKCGIDNLNILIKQLNEAA